MKPTKNKSNHRTYFSQTALCRPTVVVPCEFNKLLPLSKQLDGYFLKFTNEIDMTSFQMRKKSVRLLKYLLEYFRNEYNEEFKLFRRHHKDKINRWIHLWTVPMEWFSSFLLLSLVLSSTVVLWLMLVLSAYFFALNSKNKYYVIFAHVTIVIAALHVSSILTVFTSIITAVSMQLFAWVTQVGIGHKLIEKNSPSMTKKFTFNSVLVSLLLVADNITKTR